MKTNRADIPAGALPDTQALMEHDGEIIAAHTEMILVMFNRFNDLPDIALSIVASLMSTVILSVPEDDFDLCKQNVRFLREALTVYCESATVAEAKERMNEVRQRAMQANADRADAHYAKDATKN